MTRLDSRRRWSRNVAGSLLIAAVLATVLSAIVVSPLLFKVLAERTSGWADLANVGQAYGGIAALLSGLALVGVAVSLLLQWRQTHSENLLAVRQRHFDLVRLSIGEPVLLGRISGIDNRENALLHAYTNLWVAHWAMLWDLRQCEEKQLRNLVSQLFRSREARDWWEANGPMWSVKSSRRRRVFQAILTDECNRAVDAAPLDLAQPEPAILLSDNLASSVTDSRTGVPGSKRSFMLGVVSGGIAAAIIVARRRSSGN
jgi:hypothetical protein